MIRRTFPQNPRMREKTSTIYEKLITQSFASTRRPSEPLTDLLPSIAQKFSVMLSTLTGATKKDSRADDLSNIDTVVRAQ